MIPLYEELKEIRLERGISLEDISKITKIRPDLLEKLEQGDYTIAPQPYIRAFLREYAEVIDVDPGRVIAKFDNKEARIRDVQPSQPEPSPGEPSDRPEPPDETVEAEVGTEDEPEPPDETDDEHEAVDDTEDTIEPAVPDEEPEAANLLEDEITPKDAPDTAAIESPPEKKPEETEAEAKTAETNEEKDETTAVQESGSDLFSGKEDAPADNKQNDEPPEPQPVSVIESGNENIAGDGTESVTPRQRLAIDEPDTGGKLFFFVFLVIIVVAAVVIVILNRSGMF